MTLTRLQISSMMEEVLLVRYHDLALSKSYCETLLTWGRTHQDEHVIAFSLTYLGDYYFATGNSSECVSNLINARDIAVKENDLTLLARIYSLLGLYYESIADEQSSLQHYMEALTYSHVIGDFNAEALVLNNIAYYLQRHTGYEQPSLCIKATNEGINGENKSSIRVYHVRY